MLALALAATPAAASWSADSTLGNGVCLAPGDVLDPTMVSDGAGGFIVLWTDYRKPGFDPDLYCNRVSAAGDTLWGAGGVAVCDAVGLQTSPTIIDDGRGGAFVAWVDLRSSGNGPGYYLQHMGPNGVRRWAANGIRPVFGFNSQYAPKLCRDTTGGVFFAFASGSLAGTQLQRLDSLGIARLGVFPPAEGVSLHANPSAPLAMVADGSGGAIVTLGYGPNSLVDLAAQRVTAAGAVLWTPAGVTVCAAAGAQSAVDMVPDGLGGAVMAWTDGRVSGTDIYAQHLSAAGAPLWAADGIALCNADTSQSGVRLRALDGGDVVAAWLDCAAPPGREPLRPARAVGRQHGVGDERQARVLERRADRSLLRGARGRRQHLCGVEHDGVLGRRRVCAATRWRRRAPVGRLRRDRVPRTRRADAERLGRRWRGRAVRELSRWAREHQPGSLRESRGGEWGAGGTAVSAGWSAAVARGEALVGAPNPARGAQTMVFARPLAAGARVEVLDLLGRRVRSRGLTSGARAWTWDGRADDGARVRPGVYLVRVSGAGRLAVGRVVRVE